MTRESQNIENKTDRFYFPELDGLRFFAFLLVFLHHFPEMKAIPFLSAIQRNGWMGVDLFFVLSAYLFTKLILAEIRKTNSIDFRKFYLRRIFRIWPVYFFAIIVSFTEHIFSRGFDSELLIRVIGQFTFTYNLMAAFLPSYGMPYSHHLWSIAYEMQYYFLVPLLILILARAKAGTGKILFGFVFVLFNGIRIAMIASETPHPAIWVLPVSHFESILLGMVMGFGGLDFLLTFLKPIHIFLLGIALFFSLHLLPDLSCNNWLMIISYSAAGFSTSFILLATLNSPELQHFFSLKIWVFPGKRSYGLYLFHIFGIILVSYCLRKSALPGEGLLSFVLSFSFTFLVAVLSYRFLETPFLKMKKKFEVIVSRPI